MKLANKFIASLTGFCLAFLLVSCGTKEGKDIDGFFVTKEVDSTSGSIIKNPDGGNIYYSQFKRIQMVSLSREPDEIEPGMQHFGDFVKYRSVIYLPGYPENFKSERDTNDLIDALKFSSPEIKKTIPTYNSKLKVILEGERFTLYFQKEVYANLLKKAKIGDKTMIYYYHVSYNDFSRTHTLLAIDFQVPPKGGSK